MMKITRTSMLTGKMHTAEINVDPADLAAYMRGGDLIQNALPHLTAGEREFIMNGITQEEWNDVFGTDYLERDDN
jgi:hypothetical protein